MPLAPGDWPIVLSLPALLLLDTWSSQLIYFPTKPSISGASHRCPLRRGAPDMRRGNGTLAGPEAAGMGCSVARARRRRLRQPQHLKFSRVTRHPSWAVRRSWRASAQPLGLPGSRQGACGRSRPGGCARIGKHRLQALEDCREGRARGRGGGPAVLHQRAVVGRHVIGHLRFVPPKHLIEHLRGMCRHMSAVPRLAEQARS